MPQSATVASITLPVGITTLATLIPNGVTTLVVAGTLATS